MSTIEELSGRVDDLARRVGAAESVLAIHALKARYAELVDARFTKGRAVDASGSYEPPSGEIRKYAGARAFANLLVASDETHEAFVQQLFHHMVQQPIRAFGPRQLPELKQSFVANHDNIRKLLVEMVTASTTNPSTPGPAIDTDSRFPAWPFLPEK